jgi:hypothetical protein
VNSGEKQFKRIISQIVPNKCRSGFHVRARRTGQVEGLHDQKITHAVPTLLEPFRSKKTFEIEQNCSLRQTVRRRKPKKKDIEASSYLCSASLMTVLSPANAFEYKKLPM